jgi:prepilin-type N-terminal cleavage/methylation domain-containing protein
MMTVSSNNKGFTLLEILLAFFIFSILFVTIYASYSGSFKTINMTESRMEIYRKAAIAMDRISEDLQASYISTLPPNSFGEPAGYTRFLGEDQDINGRAADTMSFFTRIEPLFSEEMEMATGQLIFYDVVQGDEEGELILLRSENPEFINDTEERGGLTLCDGLQGITFTYFDDDGAAHESWDSDGEELEGALPRMVSVSLEFLNYENPDAPLRFMTSIALPVNYVPEQLDGLNDNDNTSAGTRRRGIKAISDAFRASNDGMKDAT